MNLTDIYKNGFKLLLVLAALSIVCTGCYMKTETLVKREFAENIATFEIVAEYIGSFDWDKNIDDSNDNRFFFSRHPEADWNNGPRVYGMKVNASIPYCDDVVLDAVEKLYFLGYDTIGRTDTSRGTIVFEMNGYDPLLKPYREEGMAYVIGNAKPKPTFLGDMAIDVIFDLGDGWYYYHGVSYPGHLDEGKTPIVFEK